MTHCFRSSRWARGLAAVLCVISLSGVAWAVFDNGDFETGTLQGWTTTTFLNFGLTGSAPYNGSSITRLSGARNVTSVVGGDSVAPLSLPDAVLGSTASLRVPRFGHYAAVVNFNRKLANANSLVQTAKITASDVDPRDGKVHLRFAYAPVLQDPGHDPWDQPYFFVVLRNVTRGNAVLYERFAYSGQPGVPWQTSGTYRYTDWQLVDMAPGNGALAVGDVVELEVIGASCALGAHAGWVYIDGFGSQVPGLALSGTGPEASRPDSRIVYNLTWRNAGNVTLDNVVVRIVMPTQTVFDGVEKISGGDCGESGGVVYCKLGTVVPGASGMFGLRAEIAAKASGTLTLGDYGISATDYPELLGPVVLTTITPDDLADLSIVMDNGVSSVALGDEVTYKIVAANEGPDDVSGAVVTDAMPSLLTGVTWTCAASGGGKCTAKGTGSIDDVVELPKGATVAYVVRGRVATAGTLSNTATITLPRYVTDTDTTNNAYTDVDPVVTNRAPATAADAYTAAEDTALVIAAPGVLGNDSDPDGDALTAHLVTGPSHGVVALAASGAFTYTAAANYAGPDAFTYRARDGQLDGPGVTVTLVVAPIDDPPTAAADSYTFVGGRLDVAAPGVLANDADIDSSPTTLTSVVVTGPSHGTLSLDRTGGFTYTATSGYVGTDQFTYAPSDGQATGTAVAVTLQSHGPYATADRYSTNEDQRLVVPAPGVASNDGETLAQAIAVELVAAPAHGTLQLDTQGGFTYDPPADWNGTATFTYAVTSTNGRSTPASVTIDVLPGDDAPTAQADAYTTAEGRAFDVAAPGVLANDADPDGTPVAAIVVSLPAHGTLVLASDGGFRYVPAPGHVGRDTFTYAASASGALSVPVTVTIDTAGPVGAGESYGTSEDTPLTVIAPGVLANDTDAAGGTLTAVVASGPLHGTLALTADGGFVYQPAQDFVGRDGFTYRPTNPRVAGAEVTVALEVTAVNDAPVGQADGYVTALGLPLAVAAPGVLANDTDADGDALSAEIVTMPAHGSLRLAADGGFTFEPAAGFTGADTFVYRASDRQTSGADVRVSITVRGPTGRIDHYTTAEDVTLTVDAPGVLGNDTSVDAAGLQAVLAAAPLHGTLDFGADGRFSYVPDRHWHGVDTFSYVARDEAASGPPVAVQVVVTPVDDAPVGVADRYMATRNRSLEVAAPGVLGNDTDADGDAVVAEPADAPAQGTVALQANGAFTYTPAAGYVGPDSFSYRPRAGALMGAPVTVSVTVQGLASADDRYTTPEDEALVVAAPGVLANDRDAAGRAMTAHLRTPPSHGTLVLAPAGGFRYVPAANFAGTDRFTYVPDNGVDAAEDATVTIQVAAADDVPTGASDRYVVARGRTLRVAAPGVLENDRDVEGASLTAVVVEPPRQGTLSLGADGAFVYTSHGGDPADGFTYRPVADGVAGEPVTVSIAVGGPAADPDAYTLSEDTELTVAAPGVLANDASDALGMQAVVVSPPAHGTLVLMASGGFTYRPDSNFAGIDQFTYAAVADGVRAAPVAVSLTTLAVNDPPTASADHYVVSRGFPLAVAAAGVLANDGDTDGDALEATLVTAPRHGTIRFGADGGFTFTPAADYTGPDAFTYVAVDRHGPGPQTTVTLDIRGALATADSYRAVRDEARQVAAPGVLANDVSVAGGASLRAQLVRGPAHGTVALEPTGAFTYVPREGFEGTDTFAYAAADGSGAGSSADVVIEVGAPPSGIDTVADLYNAREDRAVVVAAPGVLANDFAPGEITARVVTPPRSGTVDVEPDGAFTYTPSAGFTGVDHFAYEAFDTERVSAPAVVRVVVNNLDDARFFAEGLNDGVFATWLTLANPTANATSALLTFLPAVGDPVPFEVPLPAARRTTLFTAGVPDLPPGPFSVRLDAPDEVTGSRSLVWDAGAAGESALKAAPTWYLAEGATFAPFEMFYLVTNPEDHAVDVRVKYLTPAGTVTRVHRVGPLGRTTIWVDHDAPELAGAEVAGVVSSVDGSPIVVERAVYVVGPDGRYRGGHGGSGSSTVSPVWYFAEGAALNGVDTYVLVLNPGTEPAEVRVTASTDAGASVSTTRTVAPGSRETVRLADLPGLAGASFSIVVESSGGVGVVAERAAWWPTDGSGPWGEGHVAIGQLATSHEWIMAEGLSGGEYDADTYVLIFNPSEHVGRVRVRLFFEDGHPAVGTELPIAAHSRVTVRVADAFPDLAERRFGIAVESLGPARVPLVVEQAVYWRIGTAAFGAGMSAPARAVPDGGLATVAGAAPAVR